MQKAADLVASRRVYFRTVTYFAGFFGVRLPGLRSQFCDAVAEFKQGTLEGQNLHDTVLNLVWLFLSFRRDVVTNQS